MKKTTELTVPKSPADVPLKVYQHLLTCDESLQKDPYYVLGLLCGVDVKMIQAMREQDVVKVFQIAEGALKFKGQEFKDQWTHDGVKYGFHPHLEDMTLGEITDFETYMNNPADYHKAMAVAFRPIMKESTKLGGLYTIESYYGTGDRSDIMENLPLSYFFGVRTFFLTTGDELGIITQRYSTKDGVQAPT